MPSPESGSIDQYEGLTPNQKRFLDYIYTCGHNGCGDGSTKIFHVVGEMGLTPEEQNDLIGRGLWNIHPTTSGIVHPDFL